MTHRMTDRMYQTPTMLLLVVQAVRLGVSRFFRERYFLFKELKQMLRPTARVARRETWTQMVGRLDARCQTV